EVDERLRFEDDVASGGEPGDVPAGAGVGESGAERDGVAGRAVAGDPAGPRAGRDGDAEDALEVLRVDGRRLGAKASETQDRLDAVPAAGGSEEFPLAARSQAMSILRSS